MELKGHRFVISVMPPCPNNRVNPLTMDLYLRPSTEADLAQIYGWAETIRAERFMSRYVPDSRRIVLWEIIVVDGVDVGTVWLESKPDETEVIVLGILIGEPNLFGGGIGERAIK